MYKERRPHRNSQKRFYGEGKTYFITTVTYQRFPFFKEDLFCELFIDNLKICKKLKEFELYGFIIIPDHAHLLLAPIEKYNISEVMFSIKKQFSHNVNRVIGDNDLQPIEKNESEQHIENNKIKNNNIEGEQALARLQCVNRYLLNNYNKTIIQYREQFINKYGNPQHEIPKFKWQKSFYDHVIRNEKDFSKHLNYITHNSVKHNICENVKEYKWSCLNPEFIKLIDL